MAACCVEIVAGGVGLVDCDVGEQGVDLGVGEARGREDLGVAGAAVAGGDGKIGLLPSSGLSHPLQIEVTNFNL